MVAICISLKLQLLRVMATFIFFKNNVLDCNLTWFRSLLDFSKTVQKGELFVHYHCKVYSGLCT